MLRRRRPRKILARIRIQLVDRAPTPSPPQERGGRPKTYPDHLSLKALVSTIVRRRHRPDEPLAVLAQPAAEVRALHALLP